MGETTKVERRIRISADHVDRLNRLAQAHEITEDRIVEKALDILFSLTELLDGEAERRGWASLSEGALQRVWDNEEDARYDKWQELCGPPAR